MEAIINIKFEKIKGIKVDDKLLSSLIGKRLFESTSSTIKELTTQIERYFKNNKIIVKTDFKIKK